MHLSGHDCFNELVYTDFNMINETINAYRVDCTNFIKPSYLTLNRQGYET